MNASIRFGAALVGAAVIALPLVVTTSPASAAVSTKVVRYTSAQLEEAGFTKEPNLTAWSPGTATVGPRVAAAGQTVTISGKAPSFTKPGTVLSLSRFLPTDNKGSGVGQDLGITTVVDKNGNFMIKAELGRIGTWGYSVGYVTKPSGNVGGEGVEFEFQLTTTAP